MTYREYLIQCQIAGWLDKWLAPPATWTAIGHGIAYGSTPEERRERGIRAKRLGVKPGWPDIVIYHFGLYGLEVKTSTGSPSEAQRMVHADIRAAGGEVEIVRSLEQAKDFVRLWRLPVRLRARSTELLMEAVERVMRA